MRVRRKGDDIEVKVGDAVHEVIRLGAPFLVNDKGQFSRGDSNDEVATTGAGPAIPDSGDGTGGQGQDSGPVQDIRDESADLVPGDGPGPKGRHGGADPEGSRSAGKAGISGERGGTGEAAEPPGEGTGALEDQIRGGDSAPGIGAPIRPWGNGRGGKKNQAETPETEVTGPSGSDWDWYDWDDNEDG